MSIRNLFLNTSLFNYCCHLCDDDISFALREKFFIVYAKKFTTQRIYSGRILMNSSGRIISEGFALQSRMYKSRILLLLASFVFTVCPRLYSASLVKWWISSQDMKHKLSPQTDAIFAPVRQLPKTAIMVNDETTYQTIIGLGSALEHSTCYNISLLPPARQKKVLESIVGNDLAAREVSRKARLRSPLPYITQDY